jgi:hypothetical protein
MYRQYRVPICLLLKSFRCWWNPYFVRLETAQQQSNPIDHLWYRVVTGLSPIFMAYCSTRPLLYLKLKAVTFILSSRHFYTFNPFCDQWNPINVGSVPLILCYLDPIPYFRSMFFHVFPVWSFSPHLLLRTPTMTSKAQWRPLPRQTEWSRHRSAGEDPLAKQLRLGG